MTPALGQNCYCPLAISIVMVAYVSDPDKHTGGLQTTLRVHHNIAQINCSCNHKFCYATGGYWNHQACSVIVPSTLLHKGMVIFVKGDYSKTFELGRSLFHEQCEQHNVTH